MLVQFTIIIVTILAKRKLLNLSFVIVSYVGILKSIIKILFNSCNKFRTLSDHKRSLKTGFISMFCPKLLRTVWNPTLMTKLLKIIIWQSLCTNYLSDRFTLTTVASGLYIIQLKTLENYLWNGIETPNIPTNFETISIMQANLTYLVVAHRHLD